MNPAGNWMDQGISLYPNYSAGDDFTHLFMRSDVAEIQSLLHTHERLWVFRLQCSFFSIINPLTEEEKKSISAQRGGETQPVIEFMDVLCER